MCVQVPDRPDFDCFTEDELRVPAAMSWSESALQLRDETFFRKGSFNSVR